LQYKDLFEKRSSYETLTATTEVTDSWRHLASLKSMQVLPTVKSWLEFQLGSRTWVIIQSANKSVRPWVNSFRTD